MKQYLFILFFCASVCVFADDHCQYVLDTPGMALEVKETPGDLLISAGKGISNHITRGLIFGPITATIIYLGFTTSAGILLPVGAAIGTAVAVYQIVDLYKIANDLRKAGILLNRASSDTGS
jgi:hypothetical protein